MGADVPHESSQVSRFDGSKSPLDPCHFAVTAPLILRYITELRPKIGSRRGVQSHTCCAIIYRSLDSEWKCDWNHLVNSWNKSSLDSSVALRRPHLEIFRREPVDSSRYDYSTAFSCCLLVILSESGGAEAKFSHTKKKKRIHVIFSQSAVIRAWRFVDYSSFQRWKKKIPKTVLTTWLLHAFVLALIHY